MRLLKLALMAMTGLWAASVILPRDDSGHPAAGPVAAKPVAAAATHDKDIGVITSGTIGCPSPGIVTEVYNQIYGQGADADIVRRIVEHYDCQLFPEGSGVLVITRGPVFSTVTQPSIFSKDKWLYIRSADFKYYDH
jgi:hypothetical protein